jgi:hypothetical protein
MGVPLSTETSQKMVRYLWPVLFVLTLISVIEISGIFDFPGEWDGSIFTMLLGVFIGIMIGTSRAQGFLGRLSDDDRMLISEDVGYVKGLTGSDEYFTAALEKISKEVDTNAFFREYYNTHPDATDSEGWVAFRTLVVEEALALAAAEDD